MLIEGRRNNKFSLVLNKLQDALICLGFSRVVVKIDSLQFYRSLSDQTLPSLRISRVLPWDDVIVIRALDNTTHDKK